MHDERDDRGEGRGGGGGGGGGGGETSFAGLLLESDPAVGFYQIREWADVAIARHQARRLARDHGLGPRRAGEVAIVVSELASNIVKYGVRGDITIELASPPAAGAAVTVVARDIGPPIRDLEVALRDGHDDRGPIDPAELVQRGGLGTGLGAVARLTDRLEVRQQAAGKEITARFGSRPASGPHG